MLQVLEASVRFGELDALAGIDLSVADGEVVAVLGPSGSGKTTLLRVIAGLQALDAGRVLWNGTDLAPIPAHRRNLGLVFQDFALFPHLDVGRNVEFGLKMMGLEPAERRARAREALEQVELSGMERRSIATLSGGQAQRVALARALAPGPRMLLLDEPLGSLDRALRERLVVELHDLLADPSITALYVTHDQAEAFAVADRVAIIDEGRIVQRGRPEEVWRRPATRFVARFLGFRTILDVVVRDGTADAGPLGRLAVPKGTPDGPAGLVIRPGALSPDPAGHLTGVVRSRVFQGDHHRLTVSVGGVDVEVVARDQYRVGDSIRLEIDPEGLVVLGAR
jgi:thiamine transport system ATP-binding protein